jgi:hypothetical protein
MISVQVGGDIVGRIAFISPRKGEVFYLRALLSHKTAYNYDELYTFINITYDTFKNAAPQLGLFTNIDKAEKCLQEAIAFYYAPYH